MEAAIEYRRMLPSEAFAILHSLFEIAVANDEADPGSFSLETRVSVLYWMGGDMAFGVSGKASVLGPLFGIHVPLREWHKALKPSKKKTVADLCAFLAAHALVPVIPTPSLLGRRCSAAGAFLTVRQLLEQAEIDTTDLAPSTQLETFSRIGIPKIWRALIRLAPTLLSRIQCTNRSDLLFVLLAVLFIFSTIVGGVVAGNVPAIGLPWAIASLAAFVLTWQFSEKQAALPKRVVFDGLTTFRDLCKALCDTDSNRPSDKLSGMKQD